MTGRPPGSGPPGVAAESANIATNSTTATSLPARRIRSGPAIRRPPTWPRANTPFMCRNVMGAENWSPSGKKTILVDVRSAQGAVSDRGPPPQQTGLPRGSGPPAEAATAVSATNSTTAIFQKGPCKPPPGVTHRQASLAKGNHTLYVQERDAAGNWSASGKKTILIRLVPMAGGGGFNRFEAFQLNVFFRQVQMVVWQGAHRSSGEDRTIENTLVDQERFALSRERTSKWRAGIFHCIRIVNGFHRTQIVHQVSVGTQKLLRECTLKLLTLGFGMRRSWKQSVILRGNQVICNQAEQCESTIGLITTLQESIETIYFTVPKTGVHGAGCVSLAFR